MMLTSKIPDIQLHCLLNLMIIKGAWLLSQFFWGSLFLCHLTHAEFSHFLTCFLSLSPFSVTSALFFPHYQQLFSLPNKLSTAPTFHIVVAFLHLDMHFVLSVLSSIYWVFKMI